MKYLLFAGILVYMFLSTTVALKIGVKTVGTYSSFIIVFLFFFKLIGDINHKLIVKFKEELRIILLALFIIFLKIFLGQLNQIQQVLFFFIVPMMLSIVLGTENKYNKQVIWKLILVFFIAECLLAIYERIFFTNVFPEANNEGYEIFFEDWGFRSTAFLGNPLANALCVSTIMGFIIISSMKLTFKLLLLTIGFISLLCFNARGAALIWVLLTVIYFISILRSKTTKNGLKVALLLFFVVAVYFIYFAIVNYGLGGRLLNEKIIDGSALARVGVFDAFSYIDVNEFWYGNSESYIPIMHKLGAGGVENSFIVLIINYGVILFIFLCFAYLFWLKRFFKHFTLFNKFILLCSFLGVGSTNNGLVSPAPWGFLILCIYCFPFIEKKKKTNLPYNVNKNFSLQKELLISNNVLKIVKIKKKI